MKQRLPLWWPRDRRQAQSGTTLIELLVSVVIMGLALTLIIGTFSTGLLDSAVAKRDTAGVAAVQYELDQVSGAQYDASAKSYSDCFATEDASQAPATLATYQGSCPSASYTLRADVSVSSGPVPNTQSWSITVQTWPSGAAAAGPVVTIKADR